MSGIIKQNIYKLSKDITENDYKKIRDDIIIFDKTLNTFSGLLYGGIVVKFLLRNEDTNNINIWFKSPQSKDEFINHIKSSWNLSTSYNIENKYNKIDFSEYPYTREIYMITSPITTFIYMIDFLCCENIPVNNFDINCLTYNGYTFNSEKQYTENSLSTLELISNVKNKKLKISKQSLIARNLRSRFWIIN